MRSLLLLLVGCAMVMAVTDVPVNFNMPQKEHMRLAKELITNVIRLNTTGILSVLLNSSTTRWLDYHVKVDWETGNFVRGPDGKKVIAGFDVTGYDALAAFGEQLFGAIEVGCSLAQQQLWVQPKQPANLGRPYFADPEVNQVAIWRGRSGSMFYNFVPVPDKITFEDAYYTMEFARDAEGNLKISQLVAYDMEIAVPERYWDELYAEPDLTVRCRKFKKLVNDRYAEIDLTPVADDFAGYSYK